jgi:hypothetical protein
MIELISTSSKTISNIQRGLGIAQMLTNTTCSETTSSDIYGFPNYILANTKIQESPSPPRKQNKWISNACAFPGTWNTLINAEGFRSHAVACVKQVNL